MNNMGITRPTIIQPCLLYAGEINVKLVINSLFNTSRYGHKTQPELRTATRVVSIDGFTRRRWQSYRKKDHRKHACKSDCRARPPGYLDGNENARTVSGVPIC